jgi:hypothetical protein
MTATATVVESSPAAACAGRLVPGMRIPEIPPYEMSPPIPTIPTRLNRGPKSGPLKKDGFLLGCHKPQPGKLPESFRLAVRDHAMVPMLEMGEDMIFSTELTPSEGDCVLIGTIFGPDVRQYHLISETEWAGCALHPEYEHIRSIEEPMWIMAVLIGVCPSERERVAS